MSNFYRNTKWLCQKYTDKTHSLGKNKPDLDNWNNQQNDERNIQPEVSNKGKGSTKENTKI